MSMANIIRCSPSTLAATELCRPIAFARSSAQPAIVTGPTRRRGAGWAALRDGLLLTLVSACSGCSGVLDPQGPVGSAEKMILINSLAIMLTIVVPTILATLGFAWWFRASNTKAVYRPGFVYSGQIELIVWSIPVLVILLLGGIAWISSHDLDPARDLPSQRKALEIQVVSLDWKWLFIYPEQGVATVNQLVVPAATPIHFSLTSASVLNAFFVPQLGSMIYTMNGMTTQLNLESEKPGTFHGLSSHFSGDGFSGMRFELHAVADEEFATWLAKAKQAGAVLDEKAYQALSLQSQDVPPILYRGVAPNLFHAIVMQELPPGPGPDMGSAGTAAPTPER